MKHAAAPTLDRIEDLLQALRDDARLRERSRGVFYRAGRAFLHFHEDPAGVFADVRGPQDWERFRVDAGEGRDDLIRRVAVLLDGGRA